MTFGVVFMACVLLWLLWIILRDPVLRIPRAVVISGALVIGANPLWLRVASTRSVAWTTLFALHGMIYTAIVLNGGLEGPSALVITCLPVLSALLIHIRVGWWNLLLVLVSGIALEYLGSQGTLPWTAPPDIWPIVRLAALGIGTVGMLLAITAFATFSTRQTTELRLARDEAVAASGAKSRFLSMVSHELRTPMVGLMGAVELLGQTSPTEDQRELIELLKISAKSQLELIGNVLDLSRIEAGHLELEQRPVEIRQALGDVYAIFRNPCEDKGLTLRLEIDPAIPRWILADSLRLHQILSNLVGNALKFTEEGSITVQAQWLGIPAPRLRIHVIDTGIGFDPDKADELFESFRQADETTTRHFGGSGLGLAICRHLVEAMGGRIRARSTPGKGSVFGLEIPAMPAMEPPEERSTSTSITAERRLNILLADDEPINRIVLAAMLESLGHTPVEVADGRQAVEKARSQPFDLVILDIRMPELDGPGCARAIRALEGPASTVPIIALTADAVADNHVSYLDSGIDRIYSKPIDLKHLRLAIFESQPIPDDEAP